MKKFSHVALGVALALGVAGGALTASPVLAKEKQQAPKGPKLSKGVAAALSKAQAAAAAKDFAGAKAALAEAEAVEKRTAEDNHWINLIKVNVAQGSQDMAMLRQALDAAAASPMTSAEDKVKFLRVLRSLAYQANDLPGAIRYGEQLIQVAPNDATAIVELAQIYQQAKQPQQAYAMLKRAVDAQTAAGQPVPEGWYKSMAAAAVNNPAMANEFGSSTLAWVANYPSPDTWRTVLELYLDRAKLDDQAALDVYRLKRATGALKSEKDYYEYAETANLRGLPGEAKAVLDEGVSKGVLSLSKPHVKDLNAVVTPKVARDKASLASLEKEAKAAAGAKLIVGLGDAYLGYGNYAKAAEMYRAALTKSGVDAAAVNTRLGIALAMGGDKAGGQAALNSVKGGAREQLAQYWLAYINRRA